jgi:hypothetical protein
MDASVTAFLETIPSPVRQRDAKTLIELMRRVTGLEPEVNGTMIGFGTYHYEYASGRSGDASAAAFAPRKAATTVYVMDGVSSHVELLARLGPHTTGVGCIYLKDLETNDLAVLEEIVRRSYATLTAGTYGQRARG